MGLEYYSYSRFKTLDEGLFSFKRKYIDKIEDDKKTKSLTLGDAVDVLLTTPDSFYDNFIVSTVSKPTGQMEWYVDALFIKYGVMESNDNAEELAYQEVQALNGGKVRDSIEKFRENFKIKGQEYFEFMINSQGKTILSFEEFSKATNIANSFKLGKYTKFLFEEDLEIERHWQYEFDLEIPFLNKRTKGKIDNLDINHTKKTIVIRDIKTSYTSVLGFNSEFYSWRYDIQGVIYILAIEKLFPDYTITMEYVVESSTYPNIPVIWEFPLFLLNCHCNEDFITVKNKEYKSVKRLLKELEFYEENGYDEYYESAVNEGKFKLNV